MNANQSVSITFRNLLPDWVMCLDCSSHTCFSCQWPQETQQIYHYDPNQTTDYAGNSELITSKTPVNNGCFNIVAHMVQQQSTGHVDKGCPMWCSSNLPAMLIKAANNFCHLWTNIRVSVTKSCLLHIRPWSLTAYPGSNDSSIRVRCSVWQHPWQGSRVHFRNVSRTFVYTFRLLHMRMSLLISCTHLYLTTPPLGSTTLISWCHNGADLANHMLMINELVLRPAIKIHWQIIIQNHRVNVRDEN